MSWLQSLFLRTTRRRNPRLLLRNQVVGLAAIAATDIWSHENVIYYNEMSITNREQRILI